MVQSKRKQERSDFPVITLIVLFFMTLLALVIGNRYLGDDFGVVMKWWFGMLAAGAAFFPLANFAFGKLGDGGYVIAKALGIEVSSWFIWTLATFRIMKFTHINAWICLLICGVLNYGLYAFYCIKKKKAFFEEMDTVKVSKMLYYEVLFLLLFVFFCYMKSFRVTITNDTEKYMDFGFLASIMNTDYMPAADMWFSGEPINYYYYGIYVAGFLGKLADTTAGYAYNLDLMMICSLGMVQVYALVTGLLKWGIAEYEKRKKAADPDFKGVKQGLSEMCQHLGGVIGAFAVFIAGNMHYVLYGVVYPFMESVMGIEVKQYWFPDSTRFVKDGTGENAGTLIHEFPSYSFVLGDLHAHVTDITNVLLILSVLFAFLIYRSERMAAARNEEKYEVFNKKWAIREALNPAVLIASFLIGIIRMTNSWDFPIYFVVSGAIICFSNAIITGFKKDGLILTGIHAVECLVISTIVSLPFTLFFDSMTAGINICKYHSNPYELIVLWGLPIGVCIGLYMIAINRYRSGAEILEGSKSKKGKVKKDGDTSVGYIMSYSREVGNDGTVTKKVTGVNHFFSFIFRQELSDLFILTIAACAAGLVLMCELIYVKDIYGDTYSRTNTMFKLTYQAFMMFGIIMAYAVARLIVFNETKKQRKLGLFAAALLIWTFFYFGVACKAYIGDISDSTKANRTLDSYAAFKDAERADCWYQGYFAIEEKQRTDVLKDMLTWVMNNTKHDDVISQMSTTAYKPFATISAFSGRPAVIGWGNHEWLWRNGGTLDYPKEVQERIAAMKALYTTDDPAVAQAVIDRYGIDYIYVGFTETLDGSDFTDTPASTEGYTFYRGTWYRSLNVNHELLKSLGEVVYNAGTCHYAGYPGAWDDVNKKYDPDTNKAPYFDYPFEAYIVKVGK